MAATVASWTVGADHGTGSAIVVLVLAIAAIKVRLVGLDFALTALFIVLGIEAYRQRPDRVIFVETLPLGPTGKVVKARLREVHGNVLWDDALAEMQAARDPQED